MISKNLMPIFYNNIKCIINIYIAVVKKKHLHTCKQKKTFYILKINYCMHIINLCTAVKKKKY